MLNAIARYEADPTSHTANDSSSDNDEPLEHLSPGGDAGFAIRESKIGGHGVFATRAFKAGDVILHEKVLLTLDAKHVDDVQQPVQLALRDMPYEDMARFLLLQKEHASKCCAALSSRHVAETYQSCAYQLKAGVVGMGFYASWLNHSCAPNASHVFNADEKKLEVRALNDIREGDEVFVKYLGGEFTTWTPRVKRQAELLKRYHFTCTCFVCTASENALLVWIFALMDRVLLSLWARKAVKSTA